MSLVTYFASTDHSLVKAALNLTDALVVTAIVLALLREQRGRRIAFTRNEQVSLAISCVTLAIWAITRTASIAFIGFQLVMTIAYLPTLETLWRCKPAPPPEPLDTWSINAVAALIAVIVDITGIHDYIAMLYPLRALLLCLLIVALVLRWKQKSHHHPAAPTAA